MDLDTAEMCVKGWNYGQAEFNGQFSEADAIYIFCRLISTFENVVVSGPVLDFEVDNKLCFEIPLSSVSNATQGKNEAVIEFHQNDECPVSLMELRFHIPPETETDVDPVEVGVLVQTDAYHDSVFSYMGVVLYDFCSKLLSVARLVGLGKNCIKYLTQ